MIFARTKRTVQRVADDLADRGFAAAAVHGDLGQGAREQALRAFRSGKVDVLVATDVAARGIDVTDVTHVINYQCPEDAKTYVHRIGRTGRAGKEGVAVTLVDWDELHRWKTISDDLGLGMPEAPETYSTSDHLYADLEIPTNSRGRLPHSKRTRAGLDAEYVDTEGDQGGGRKRRERSGRDRKRGDGADEVAVERSRPRRDRSRTRSRAGVIVAGSVEGETASEATPNTTAPASAGEPAGGDAPAGEPGSTTEQNKPRRRRRRGGARQSSAGGDAEQQAPDAAAS
jgi:superfamily II DNA/RNA helicase